ncbi:MAG: glutamate--tRNA ligase [Cyclobacteriaceae bacterium]|nr:glutamate--tRNA ligase [Cyclobacteriaceae bacterium]UYN87126.1 MAG: glutamate--tRNA ligase [Cyclobacteriaceae bacterium]
MKDVRVRFAPSPTGALHIGGVRTALYNFLLARQQGGTMILRIEDTDQNRYVPGAEEYIMESLDWAGIKIDEGVREGGPYAPYRQSERKHLYQQYAQQLLSSGHAYYAFDTEQEIEALRERQKAAGSDQQQYSSATRSAMRNSLTLSSEDTRKLLDSGVNYVIRFKIPENQTVVLNDLIRGEVTVNTTQLDDKVLMKSDGMPTYHLANVVDDYLMKISHVIRGEEWLPSAPLHVLLYKAFGWEKDMPRFAHLPLLLKPDGNGKLSKRDADRMGFPIFPLNWTDPSTGEQSTGYKESGYLPEALINFLAFLGWNPGTEQEIFSMHELIQAFSVERIGKAGAKFDIQKAQWFNQQYLRAKTDQELAAFLLEQLKLENISCTQEKAENICALMKERITFPQELWEHGKFFFRAPESFDESVVTKKWNDDAVKVITAYRDAVEKLNAFDATIAKETLEQVTASLQIGTGKILQALRVAMSGLGGGPDLMMIMEIIGKDEVVGRLTFALQNLKQKVS